MLSVSAEIMNRWYETIIAILPGILGAILVLILGWIAGRLLGKLIRIVFDKITQSSVVKSSSSVVGSLEKSGITAGYVGDIAVRCFVYLIAILAAVDILNLEHLSNLMTDIVGYIPHIVAFVVIILLGFLLIDYFIDFLSKFYSGENIEFITPVLFLMRIFLYFVLIVLGLSQLMLDLTIIYTFVTPIAWGIGIGLGAAIAIIVGFGLRNKSEEIMEKVLRVVLKK